MNPTDPSPQLVLVGFRLDAPSLAALQRLQDRYRSRLKVRTVSASSVVRRALDALDEQLRRLTTTAEQQTESVRFRAYRKARP